jgi:hypothetical protein
MSARNNRTPKVNRPEQMSEDSKRTYVSYHAMQLERDQFVSSIHSVIIPLLDLLDETRSNWKRAEDKLNESKGTENRLDGQVNLSDEILSKWKAAEDRASRLEREVDALKLDKKRLEELVEEYDRRVSSMQTTVQNNLADTTEFVNMRNKIEIGVQQRVGQNLRRSKSVSSDQKVVRPKRVVIEESNQSMPKLKSSIGIKLVTAAIRKNHVEVRKSPRKRSISVSRMFDDDFARRRFGSPLTSNNLRIKTPTSILRNEMKGRATSKCLHSFNIYSALMGSCIVCNQKIMFMDKTLQCESCKMCVHEHCKVIVPISSSSSTSKRSLSGSYQISSSAIPDPLIRCINELEKNRLNTEGVYETQGSKEKVLRLYESFDKCVPNLALEPTETITGCIKVFFRKLKEPLIPCPFYNEFMQLVVKDEKLVEAIGRLPKISCEILAYLCLHLRKVALNSAMNKMPIKKLAFSLGQEILGNTAINTFEYVPDNNDPFDEALRQRFALKRLLKMPAEFWLDYLDVHVASG